MPSAVFVPARLILNKSYSNWLGWSSTPHGRSAHFLKASAVSKCVYLKCVHLCELPSLTSWVSLHRDSHAIHVVNWPAHLHALAKALDGVVSDPAASFLEVKIRCNDESLQKYQN